PGGGRRGPRDGGRVRARPGSEPGKALAVAGGRKLPSAGGAEALDQQAGQQGTTPAGDTHGARPGGAGGAPSGAGADFRAGLRGAELRVSSATGLQGGAAPCRYAAQAKVHLGGGRGFEELLRHHPATGTAGAGESEGLRRANPEAAGSVSEARGAGGNEPLDTGSGNAPRRGDQSVAVQYLSGCARPREGCAGHGDG